MDESLLRFEAPTPLADHQVEKLGRLQRATLDYARLLTELLPNVPARRKALDALFEVKQLGESAIRIGRTIVDRDVLKELFAPVENRDVRVARAWFNAKDFADIRHFCRDDFDPTTDIANLRRGIQGVIWGAEIRISRKIPVGSAVVVGEDQGDDDLDSNWAPTEAQLIRLW